MPTPKLNQMNINGQDYDISADWANVDNKPNLEKPSVECTQAEYDALVQAGTVQADVTYFITDGV